MLWSSTASMFPY
ncbi:hypothetical protein C5167_039849 [Papaver somniferum]|uniref:Uncharacterized protein n=1 Tax=Papaver somniferum TaxID=3469 RepID=A0A4Y7IGS3_PAPSO|nr:hypothetical protein C5167_039849 [Papaver somniferum]